MRLITTIFLVLVLAIQYPLWFGRGGWLRTHEMGLQLDAQLASNAQLRARNDKLAAEVKDLKQGAGAVEERARFELGMIKDGEIFVQIIEPAKTASQSGPGATAGAQAPAPVGASFGAQPPATVVARKSP